MIEKRLEELEKDVTEAKAKPYMEMQFFINPDTVLKLIGFVREAAGILDQLRTGERDATMAAYFDSKEFLERLKTL